MQSTVTAHDLSLEKTFLEEWIVKRVKESGWLALAPEVEERAEGIIDEHHPLLRNAHIFYLYRIGSWRVSGKLMRNQSIVVPDIWRQLCCYDLVVLVNKNFYEGAEEKGKNALIDNSLNDFKAVYQRGEIKWRLRRPDIVEHSTVLKRNGICFSQWDAYDDIEMQQLSFLDINKTVDETYAAENLGSGKSKEAPEVVNYCVEMEEVTEEDLLPKPGEEVQVLYEAAPPAAEKAEGPAAEMSEGPVAEKCEGGVS